MDSLSLTQLKIPTHQVRSLLRRQSSKEFWDENGEGIFYSNLMFAGSSGLMAWILMILCKIAGLDKNMHRKIPVDPKKSWFISMSAWIISQPWMWEWLAPLGGVRIVFNRSRILVTQTHLA